MSEIFSTELLAALVLVLVSFQLKPCGALVNLMKIRLRSTRWSPVTRAEVPAHALHLLDCARTALAALGFEPVHTEAAPPFNLFDPRPRMYAEIHWQAHRSMLAMVELAEPLSGQVTKVHLLSLFTDGTALLTVNREQWAQLPLPRGIAVGDAYADDLEGQWRCHQDALAREAAGRSLVTDKTEALRRQAALGFPRWLARMQELGWVKQELPGTMPSPRRSPGATRASWRGRRRASAAPWAVPTGTIRFPRVTPRAWRRWMHWPPTSRWPPSLFRPGSRRPCSP